MEKKYIVQDLETRLYWYGYYSNKQWAADISEAKRFDTKQQALEALKYQKCGFFTVVKVWSVPPEY